ncbi:MAG TPA: C10 family peptidase [Bacteroidales bacterium]|nr:C10 family peptidase [Bacteroidales bacterium]HPS16526.1 C10 family peptidase [Bacteroidales bacterium]
MGKRKITLLIIIMAFAFAFNVAFAGNVDVKTAKNVALNAYREKFSNLYDKSAGDIFITDEFLISENSQLLYYVFNTSNGGFIMVAANDIFIPILGYSFEGIYGNENQPEGFKYWVSNFKKEIVSDISAKITATPEIETAWSRYKVSPENYTFKKGTKDVEPLLLAKWDQGACYNALCPAAAAGDGGHCYVGCVATSMAQIMYYYRYPEKGQNSYSYPSSYGTLSASFGTTTYDWNAMANSCNGENLAIATLSYHCGIAVKMNYGTDGSSAQTTDWKTKLPLYFKYSSDINYAYKSSYSTAVWENMIRAQIDAKHPIEYTGYDESAGAGHAFNLDGYQDSTYFHFNWGWSGYYNGYFYLTALNPTGNDFTSTQHMVYNIYPPTTSYPEYCSGNSDTLTSAVGTLTDGSGPSEYKNDVDCSWLISPSTLIDHLILSFDAINTESTNDIITIYDGPNTSSPVLGIYSGTTIPSQITSTSPQVLVTFKTNSSTVSEGWQIYYYSVYPIFCSGLTTLTAASGTFNDGSDIYNYNNGSNCIWEITPPNAATVTLHFESFNLESSDNVRVYDMDNTSSPLATYTGTVIPADVTSPSGKMRVIFKSNTSITAEGFTASYTSSLAGVEEFSAVKDMNIYPNPASSQLHVSFDIIENTDVTIKLMDLTGRQVYSEIYTNGNKFEKDIDISGFTKGVYNLQIITSGDLINKKIVVE